MKKSDLKKYKLPDSPGVYLFRGARRTLLYVGKATSLKHRVRSYFSKDIEASRGPLITKMLNEAQTIQWEETDSVLEALILEANLIKKHQPPYNTREKDNKSFNYLVITKEDFPRVLVVRGRDLFSKWNDRNIKVVYGPFPSGGSLKEAVRIVRKIFPFRDRCEPGSGTPCFNAQIGLCPGVCSGVISKTEYAKTIRRIQMLFEGKKKSLLERLEREMRVHATREEFEAADERKRQMFALTHIRDASMIGDDFRVSSGGAIDRIEGYDVAHISETARVGVMVVIEDGKPSKSAYRTFNIQTKAKGDTAALEEILRRRLAHTEWQLPSVIVVDGGLPQKNAAKRALDAFGYAIPLVNIVKNERHKAARVVGNSALIAQSEKALLLANSEAHRFALSLHRRKRDRVQ